MNERIKELAEQAGIRLDFFGLGSCADGGNPDIGKFAELIVQECANVGERYANGNYEVYNQILARFGMEEDEE